MKCTRPVLERCKIGPVEIVERPCGKCPACLSNRAQEWTYRLFAESKLHKKSCFVTLTINDENLLDLCPLSKSGNYCSLNKKLVQLFMKRLRKNLTHRIRFYAVGEYGEHTKRPHYHAIIFGIGPEDRQVIESCWPYGFVSVASVVPGSIAYVARYCVKKLFSDSLDYESEGILPEFSLMSNRPGIGFNAMEKGVRRTSDGQMFVWYQGKRFGVPKYFKQKIRSAYEAYIARVRSVADRDREEYDYSCSSRSRFAEQLQSEKNRLARCKPRRKV